MMACGPTSMMACGPTSMMACGPTSMMACGPTLRRCKMIAEDKISVADYAQRAIKEEEQVTDAAKLLEEWAHQDAELKAALLEPLLKQACYQAVTRDRKSTRLNSSHVAISYAVFC